MFRLLLCLPVQNFFHSFIFSFCHLKLCARIIWLNFLWDSLCISQWCWCCLCQECLNFRCINLIHWYPCCVHLRWRYLLVEVIRLCYLIYTLLYEPDIIHQNFQNLYDWLTLRGYNPSQMKPLFHTSIECKNWRLLPPPTLSAVLTIKEDIMMK